MTEYSPDVAEDLNENKDDLVLEKPKGRIQKIEEKLGISKKKGAKKGAKKKKATATALQLEERKNTLFEVFRKKKHEQSFLVSSADEGSFVEGASPRVVGARGARGRSLSAQERRLEKRVLIRLKMAAQDKEKERKRRKSRGMWSLLQVLEQRRQYKTRVGSISSTIRSCSAWR